MKFKYEARDGKGVFSKGTMEKVNESGVAAELRERKLIPIKISAYKAPLQFGGVSSADVTNFTRQLSTMITAGLPINDALNLLRMQASATFAPVVSSIMTDVSSGVGLSDAMAKFPKVFSKVYIALIRAGEAAGVLEKILNRLADNMEKNHEFRGKVMGAMIYPIIILFGMVGVIIVMMVFVVPKLTSLYGEFGADLPLATKILVGTSNFMIHDWWLIIILIAVGFYGLRALITNPDGKRWIDGQLYKIPVIGNLTRQIMLTELTRTLGLLVGAGISIVEALNIVSGALGNVVVESEVRKIALQVEKGFPVSISFSESSIFPVMIGQMIAVGEETGKMDEVLEKLSSYYESESEQKVKGLTTAIEPLIIMIMAVGVGFLVFSIIIPIYDITNKV